MKKRVLLNSVLPIVIILSLSLVVFGQKLTVRNAHSMVYDSQSNRVLLFGGADEKKVYGDLWSLGKNGWNLIKTDGGPGPRTFAGMAFDEAGKRLIVFGGNRVLFGNDNNRVKLLNDTWEFKGGKWRKISKGIPPEARAEGAMVYDKAGKRIILFGGYKIVNNNYIKLNDTWELKGDEWQKLGRTFITPRNGAALAYDEKIKKVMLFGGATAGRDYGEKSGETWFLEGGSWRRLRIEQPPNIFNSNMVFDKTTKTIFRFGGWNGKSRIDETWEFKDRRWTKLDLPTSPPARNHAGMVYDPRQKQIILFGGHNGEKIFGDLWILRRGKWYKEFESPPIKRVANGH